MRRARAAVRGCRGRGAPARGGGAERRVWLQAFNNRNAQKCAIAHLIRHSGLPELAIERRWGSDRVAPPTVAGVCGGTYAHRGAMAAVLVEQRHSVALEVHPRRRVDGRAWHAHLPSLRELRVRLRVLVVTSSESLSTAGLSRCPRTVLKAQLLLFTTYKGEANALRKSRLRDELLLVKAQLRFFGRSPARRPR